MSTFDRSSDHEVFLSKTHYNNRQDSGNSSPPLDLRFFEKVALLELRSRLESAIRCNQLSPTPGGSGRSSFCASNARCYACGKAPNKGQEDVTLWGIPLLPSRCHDGTDTVLIKFLRAADFDPGEAFRMLKRTLKWRKEFKIEGILHVDHFGSDYDDVLYFDGTDREGRPLYFYKYGAFEDKALFEKTFGTCESREKFVRWRVRSMENGIGMLGFQEGGVSSFLQITDMKNSIGHLAKEVAHTTKKAVVLFQDHYPEIISKNIVVNAPLSSYLYGALLPHFFPQRMISKCIFVRPRKVTETLLKYVDPENIPIEYGGLKRKNDRDFVPGDEKIQESYVRGGAKCRIEIPVIEGVVTVVWDLTVVGLDVSYKEEFIPEDDCSYKILIEQEKKMKVSVRNSFYINEPGKVVLTVYNSSFKRKKIFYRYKIKPVVVPLYNFHRVIPLQI